MKYCIIYVQPNIFADEKISVGLVCLTDDGCTYKYSARKMEVSGALLTDAQKNYVQCFVTEFRKNYIDGRSNQAILSKLDTLYRYSINYVIFSPVRELDIPTELMSPERLYSELIENYGKNS